MEGALIPGAALTAAGASSRLISIVGGGHGSWHAGMQARIESIFDRYLRGMDVGISTDPLIEPAPAGP